MTTTMLITRFWSLFPSRRSLATVAISSVLGGVAAIGVSDWLQTQRRTSPSLLPIYDQRYVALGRSYLPILGDAYAVAWEQGASALDAGQPIAAALDTVAQTW